MPTDMVFATALAFREADTSVHWYTRDTAAGGTSQVAVGSISGGAAVICGWVLIGARESGTISNASNYAGGTTTSSAGFHGVANLAARATQYFLNGVATGAAGSTSA